MAYGSIGKKEGQSAKEQHPPSSHPGHPMQGRIHAPSPKGGKK